ncbi:MAG: glucuronate isomerase, partial [Pseudomonadota bacterium]
MALLNPDRLLPSEGRASAIARDLYDSVCHMPIISPHGHTDPGWYALNEPFGDPAGLFVTPDHYVFRMLVSQGMTLDELGIPRADGTTSNPDPRDVWRLFAANYFLFRGTPTSLWIDHSLEHVFGIDEPLTRETADRIYDRIDTCLAEDAFRPRALYERFNIEAIATTESALDDLHHHRQINASGWTGRVVTTYRPDAVVDPDFDGFDDNVVRLGALTDCDVSTYDGYLDAHRKRRAFFKSVGATATDHGHPSARTADLPRMEAEALYATVSRGAATPEEAELFRAQMLTEMAVMSLEDGLVMQIHPGSQRNHSERVFEQYGRDKGFDIPARTEYVAALRPLLSKVGMEPKLTVIVFTLDETSYARELAPLAGAYPALRLGPPWWFHDSFEGIRRFRQMTTETAGFYNTVGFNDDTRAFCSIPAR